MKDRKTDTFIYKGLGIPIKLVNVPMKKVLGEWAIDVDVYIRLYALNYLHAKDKEFRSLYNTISHASLSKKKGEKIRPISIDAIEDLKSA